MTASGLPTSVPVPLNRTARLRAVRAIAFDEGRPGTVRVAVPTRTSPARPPSLSTNAPVPFVTPRVTGPAAKVASKPETPTVAANHIMVPAPVLPADPLSGADKEAVKGVEGEAELMAETTVAAVVWVPFSRTVRTLLGRSQEAVAVAPVIVGSSTNRKMASL